MSLSKTKIFLLVCVMVNVGLSFGFQWNPKIMAVMTMFFIVLFTTSLKNKPFLLIAILGMFVVCAGYWSRQMEPVDLSQYFGEKKTQLEIVISTDPEVKNKSHTFIASVISVNHQVAQTKIAVVMPKYPQFDYGTYMQLEGELEAVSEFNQKDNVSAQTIFPKVIESKPGHGNRVKKFLYQLKHKLLADIDQIVPSPESGLLGGLLLGTRHMPEELLEQFRITGTSHIVAVSGFNVTIVALFLDKLFRSLGRSVSFYASMLAITAFVIITGASASVVRAGIMGSLVLVAQHFGRIYASVNSLLLACAIMLFQNPKLLQFDIGFQLSFAALAGLLLVQPLLDQKFPNANIIVSTTLPTIAAQVTTVPIILYHFGNLSLISVFSNFLVLPLIPVAMLLGFLAIMGFMLLPSLGILLGSSVWFVLHYIVWAISWTSKIPLASISNLPFPLWVLILYYLILTALLWKQKANY